MPLNQSNLQNYFRVVDLLGCRRNGLSLAQAAELIVSGRRQASRRARRAARTISAVGWFGRDPWVAINQAAGYLRPERPRLRLVKRA